MFGEEFKALEIGITVLSWFWILLLGVHIVCQRLRSIVHDHHYASSWYDGVTSLVVIFLLFKYGVL